MNAAETQVIAAVDLGSNSFHMKVARVAQGRLAVLDRMREGVRLAAGLDDRDVLGDEACERALRCLERFGERLKGVDSENVRAVGTNTLRRSRNAERFLSEAEAALGHPIEVISGREEARLIYLGVAHSTAPDAAQRLVVDIGGGSTEIIVGRHFQPLCTESLYVGCVGMSRELFGDGRIDEARMRAAVLAARQELEPLEAPYRRLGWEVAIGASGTIRSAADVIRAQGWSRKGITAKALAKLRSSLVKAGDVDAVSLPGLQPARAPVFPGGVAILVAVFEALDVGRMVCADGALREGLLYDLIGRLEHHDVREATIDDLCRRYRVDEDQARRVAATARSLREQAMSQWPVGHERFARLLDWAARLHELGLDIAHGQYHKHGAYVLDNADLAGFSRQEQSEIAALVRVHRRKFATQVFDDLPKGHRASLLKLAVLLRVAVVLNRPRQDLDPAEPRAEAGPDTLRLEFAPGWLEAHPLAAADLERDASYLKSAGIALRFE